MKTSSFLTQCLFAIASISMLLVAIPVHAAHLTDQGVTSQDNAVVMQLPTGLGYSINGDFGLTSNLDSSHLTYNHHRYINYSYYQQGTLSYKKNTAAFMPPKQQLQNTNRQYRDSDGRLNRFNIGVDAVRSVTRLIRN